MNAVPLMCSVRQHDAEGETGAQSSVAGSAGFAD